MCGITGFWRPAGLEASAGDVLLRMTDCLRHRGPDDGGAWTDAERGVALGHRRLSIIDLSIEGHQPMVSADGRFVVVYNGEIYNFKELRTELLAAGDRFRGHSDTEVMLAAFSRWGVQASVRRLAGMFACAIWDRHETRLHLVRDRLGEKPLYYGWQGDTLLFGSELKALRLHPAFHAEVDRDALTLFLRFAYIPSPWTIYRGMRKLEPATMVTITPDGREATERYWKLEDVIASGRDNRLQGSESGRIDALEARLRATIREEMISDRPLGAFLSGGIDSSTIVALMQQESSHRVRTFTIGFEEGEYDEARHAAAVAAHLGTDHTELYVTPAEALQVVPRLPGLYDEPFADSSQVPTFLLAALTRQHVTVALSGDGGDELLGGYNRYFLGGRLWRGLDRWPLGVRRAAAALIKQASPSFWGSAVGAVQRGLPAGWRIAHPGDRMHKLADVLPSTSMSAMYRRLVSHWEFPEEVVVGGREPPLGLGGRSPLPAGTSGVEEMMYWDARTYLPDDVMVKVDRATMAVGLEARAPFLDHRVVELAWRLPAEDRFRAGQGKWAMRQVLYRHVPQELVERPKMGFGVPIDHWLRGALREWAGDLLNADSIRREGILRPEPIERLWNEHQSGRRNWQYHLWDVLMFRAWQEASRETGRAAEPAAMALTREM